MYHFPKFLASLPKNFINENTFNDSAVPLPLIWSALAKNRKLMTTNVLDEKNVLPVSKKDSKENTPLNIAKKKLFKFWDPPQPKA